MAKADNVRTYPKFLSLPAVAAIARDLKQRGEAATVTAEEARMLVNSYMTWRERAKAFAKVAGDAGECRSCGATIYWVKTRNGKRAPYDGEGISHFATCPNANRHRGAKD